MKRLQGCIQEVVAYSGAVSCDPSWPVMSALCSQKYLNMDNADARVTLFKMLGEYLTSRDLEEMLLILFMVMLVPKW